MQKEEFDTFIGATYSTGQAVANISGVLLGGSASGVFVDTQTCTGTQAVKIDNISAGATPINYQAAVTNVVIRQDSPPGVIVDFPRVTADPNGVYAAVPGTLFLSKADRDSHQRCAIQAMVDLSAIKAQKPVARQFQAQDGSWHPFLSEQHYQNTLADGWPIRALYAAPVSEAKAQGVVMPERWNVPRPMWKDARQPYGNPLNHADIEAAEKFNLALDEVARLNAAPVQQVHRSGL